MLALLILFLSFATSLALTAGVRRILLARAMLDHPNERSSHKTPVPRGGGWAILGVVGLGMGLFLSLHPDQFATLKWLFVSLLLLAGISWVDDRRGVPPLLRLALHLLAAFLGSHALPPEASLFQGALPFALDRGLMILGWAWFMNAYNFMDGIDGITGGETISIATGLCFFMSVAGLSNPFITTLTLILTGACLGFLVFNWHPAKIFLGDVGSVPLGFLSGFALLTLATQGHLIAALILPLYYLADSGITITKRALRREKIWQAHRQHFYQRAAAGWGRHDRVVYQILAANGGLIGAGWIALTNPWLGGALGIVIVALLLIKLHKAAGSHD